MQKKYNRFLKVKSIKKRGEKKWKKEKRGKKGKLHITAKAQCGGRGL